MTTHLSLHYPIVVSTKHRRPIIAAAWRPRLHAYLMVQSERREECQNVLVELTITFTS